MGGGARARGGPTAHGGRRARTPLRPLAPRRHLHPRPAAPIHLCLHLLVVRVGQVGQHDAQRAQHAQRAPRRRIQLCRGCGREGRPSASQSTQSILIKQSQPTGLCTCHLVNSPLCLTRADVVVQLVQVHLAFAARHAHLPAEVVDGLSGGCGGCGGWTGRKETEQAGAGPGRRMRLGQGASILREGGRREGRAARRAPVA